jgi:hypothetical protein
MLLALIVVGAAALLSWDRLWIRESGHGFVVGEQLVMAEFGYSRGGDELRWAVLRTFPLDSTKQQRLTDPRVGRTSLVWPLVRQADGRMVPVGTGGDIYFFEGDKLRTMQVKMSEHTDTVPLEDCRTVEEMWGYLERFRAGGE